MKKLLFIGVLTLVVGFLFFGVNNEEAEFSALQRIDPIPHAKELIAEEKYAEANEYLNFFLDYDYVLDNYEAIELAEHINETRDSWSYQLGKINSGFWSGESDESEGQYAAMASDFLVVGDIRDLGEEGIHYLNDEDVDEVTVTLAGVGVVLAAGTVATAGGLAAAKGVASLVKRAYRLGKLPKWLQKKILNNPEQLPAIYETISTLKKSAGMASTLELLAISKNEKHFRKLANFGAVFQGKTIVLLKILGDGVVSMYQKTGTYSKELFLEAATFGKDGIKVLNTYGAEKFIAYKNSRATIRVRTFIENIGTTAYEKGLVKNANIIFRGGKYTARRNSTFSPNAMAKGKGQEGKTNLEVMRGGNAPTGRDGATVQLHHLKQKNEGTIIEMQQVEHGMHSNILHSYKTKSEIDRNEFGRFRGEYWKERAKDFE